ncbi:uncharacterized protein BDR25DRAFT_331118 [Lindgomyces ingoldianus]|uniref:Uncharacterized protein n=1 Tax=Lindgomyces ingoldianus TaxID=673940 RepID=A0ACB6RD06_9PLEO|nr:uncharacterized protein BDR25DRAFT_331118 [Lindgomyces ingoldianus]KAF2476212.1 hypothetical protein BDR25DRAFT_331118 [Lindgomyces ingoldianus]
MATAKDTTRSRIENIKTSLRSITTCTSTTVSELQEILAEKAQEVAQKENLRSKGSRLLSVQPNSRTRVATKVSTIAVDVAKPAGDFLAAKEKYILATEVANTTLKSLADALKTPPPSKVSPKPSKSKTPAPEGQSKPAPRSGAHVRSASYSQKPLQERSVSQVVNSPQKRYAPRRSSSYSACLTTGPAPGLVATAECARIAFAYLRTPEAAKVTGKDAPELQLENGILALAGKLLAHGLDSLAIKELRILKKRLDQFLGWDNEGRGAQTAQRKLDAKKPSGPVEKESLTSLLDFGDIDKQTPALPLIISHQTYALRLIAATRHPRVIEALWDFLKLSNPSSLPNLVLYVAQAPSAQAKATRQLESFSQIVLSLCPSISSSNDPVEGKDILQPSPEIVLRLQHLAFKVRQSWWTLANHDSDEKKELMEPFAKCLTAFSRRSKLLALKKYKIAETLYVDLLKSTEDSIPLQQVASPGESAAKILSSLAQAAGLTDVALRWMKEPSSLDSKDSAARTASRLVRVATLSIDASIKEVPTPGLADSATKAMEALSGSLSGSSSDLDILFAEVNGLRRIASRAISLAHNHSLGIVAASIRFLVRFVGTRPSANSDTKAHVRYGERILMTAKSMKSIVDCVLACTRLLVDSDDRWTSFDNLVQDCVSILQHFEEPLGEELSCTSILPTDLHFPLVKLSNAYWALYLQLRKANSSPSSLIKAMQRSVELLQSRPKPERQSGLLAMKTEKLGDTLDSIDRGEDSRNAFYLSIKNLLDSGVLQTAAELALNHPIRNVFDMKGTANTLGRVLKMYHRSFLKYGVLRTNELAFFDDSTLPIAERGILLEWQLNLFPKALARNRPWNSTLNASLQIMSECLLELYTEATFPIRRQRVFVILLQIAEIHPGILPQGMLHINTVPGAESFQNSQDQGLSRYGDHLKAFLKLKSTMRDGLPSIVIMQECLFTWQSMIDSVSSWKDLTDWIDDSEPWLQQMQAVADYLAAKGEDNICIPALRLLVKIMELEKNPDTSRLVSNLCALGLHLLRLGYSEKAGLAFAKAESVISSTNTSTEARLQWHLAYAEYLLKIGNLTKCQGTLSSAKTVALDDAQFMELTKASTTLSGRVRFNKILADACYVHSLLAINAGSFKEASRYAKRCVALNRRIWACLENKSNCRKVAQSEGSETDGEGAGNGTFDTLSSIRNEKGVSLVMSITHDTLNGPEFWPVVPPLYRGLMLQSLIYSHQGLLQEALYAAEQAEKIASATHSRFLLVENCSHRAEYWAQGDRPDKAQDVLDKVDLPKCHKHLSIVRHCLAIARIHHANKKGKEELAVYETLERLLKDLTGGHFIRSLDAFPSAADSLAQQMSAVSLDGPLEKDKSRVTRTRARNPTPKAAPKVAPKAPPKAVRNPIQQSTSQPASIADVCSVLNSLQAEVARRKALAYVLQEDSPKAIELLDWAQRIESGERDFLHLFVTAKALLSQSIKELAKNFTFNTLPESTIAFPAVSQTDRKSVEAAVAKRANRVISASTMSGKGKKANKEDFIATLRQARDSLVEAHALCSKMGTNSNFQQVSNALGHVTVLLSAASCGDLRGSLHPLYVAYMNELPKDQALKLCQESIEVEQESLSREEFLKWPELGSCEGSSASSVADFQKDYIDIIPESWTTVSLALNDAHDELYITRYQSGQSPFVLRLPMSRHTSRDMDEEEFSFEDGRKDFNEIIELSDFSTRNAKDMTSREARAQWWDEREALDMRLRELLLNIENIWLGGFKGIFSQHARQPTLLARFRKSFETILNQYLPSRRGKSQQKRTVLDTRVLELFVGLGDATNDELDLDEALMDLIYFVVDILQFNGESNAYDEIDFDAIVVETLDALRAYHSALQGPCAEPAHTILILDKNLHRFPWESMPCLQSIAISRLPSLAALRERILAARSSDNARDDRPGHYIPASAGGTSILNPSGDLSHTSKTLKPRLENMEGPWTHITDRAPTEKEFESSLKAKELVLYFGHGSGAQFVRSKSVRRLYAGRQIGDKKKRGCATTFLFGCSSVHLTENGFYEPSGMLASYLTAGAPAVLGMLWDVTDKDCDRFAVKAAELWGLWPETKDDAEPKAKKKSKGKGKVAQLVAEVENARGAQTVRRGRKARDPPCEDKDEMGVNRKERRRGVGLDEAVREARDACFLRYLNGAAAVVYGIPVYLE